MAVDNRDNQENKPGAGQTGTGRSGEGVENNPQDGSQWDNYQTRSLSSEGEGKIEESDLLSADEVPGQKHNDSSDSAR